MVRMDRQITLQSMTRTNDSMGGGAEAWANYASFPTVWAQVMPGRGREELNGDRVEAVALYTFVIRNRTDISETDRIVWDSVAYNIRRIERRGPRPLYLYIHAERGVGV